MNIQQVYRGIPTQDGAGVSIRRAIGSHLVREIDPFLLLDELHSDNPDDYLAGFPSHPHRGFETITYMLQGNIRHKDSMGNEGLVGSGGVQWMRAGRGIIHSEIPEQSEGLLWGFQIWVNLPAADKFGAPAHYDLPADTIPEFETPAGARVRVIAGYTDDGREGPLQRSDIDLQLFDVRLPADRGFSWSVAPGHTLLVYVYSGELVTPPARYPHGALLVIDASQDWQLVAGEEGAGVLLLAARPIGEPIVRAGPFVLNTEAELRQAIDDFQNGRLVSSDG
ncbi:redox-sensitive bicupin YhaK (pirin superfamily) [Methylohalomonas lacus]|uniref:Redox-sensitive bicupin YhaK (Pirin superfamily) n=1 Tax=Methylohalomonas lacus TaxID=398773 RepID=A0AAE3HHW7_9GAMM|nr:pirin family protein [Methylohalomonas lacus]MCS3902646.1 redox-sensitive bicupin YhaK (pirin superfamily) [Methylohalomonas lacus]